MKNQIDNVITKKCKRCGHSFSALKHYDTYDICVVCEAGQKRCETYEMNLMNRYADLKAAVGLALKELEKFDDICWGYDGDRGSGKIVERAINYLENQINLPQAEQQEPEAFPIQIQPDGSASI